MSSSFLFILIAIAACLVLGAAFLFLFSSVSVSLQKFNDVLQKYDQRWSSALLDGQIEIREFFENKPVQRKTILHFTPDGLVVLVKGATILLYKKEGSPLEEVCKKAFTLDSIGLDEDQCWIQGGNGSVSLHGHLNHPEKLIPLAEEWGWKILKGKPLEI